MSDPADETVEPEQPAEEEQVLPDDDDTEGHRFVSDRTVQHDVRPLR